MAATMARLSLALVVFTFAFFACDGAFLEFARSQHIEEPKEDKPKEKKSECPEADPLKKKVEEMEGHDDGFLEAVKELQAAVEKCEQKKAKAAREKADATVKKEWTKGDIQKPNLAVEEPPKEDQHLGAFAACRDRDLLKTEIEKMEVTDDGFVKKCVELTEKTRDCRDEKAKPIRKKANAETADRWAEGNMTPSTPSFMNASSLHFGNEQMNVQAQQFMKVDLGPFASAAEACDYCFDSFTKSGESPAGPVAPFCVCMAYPKGGKHNMFCATPPSAAGYIQEKNGCRCKAKDMEAMGKTTCQPI